MRRPCCQPGPACTPPSWHTDSRVTRVTGFTHRTVTLLSGTSSSSLPHGSFTSAPPLDESSFLLLPRPVLRESAALADSFRIIRRCRNDTIEDDPRLHSAAQLFKLRLRLFNRRRPVRLPVPRRRKAARAQRVRDAPVTLPGLGLGSLRGSGRQGRGGDDWRREQR
eukprot:356273-Hanusia_phi.AAC.1